MSYRELCPRCLRPVVVCFCAHVETVETRTRVLMLQHPRERDMPVGTVRIAKLALPGATVRVGVDFSADPVVRAAMADRTQPAVLLFPGPGSRDLATEPPDGPVTLIIVDGTWTQAGKLLRANPALRALPCYRFDPPAPSSYRIRREPADHCVATIEAVAHALALLERDDTIVPRMLRPFHAMVERQLEFAAQNRGTPSRHAAPRKRPRRPRPLPRALIERPADDLVVVYGEANDWPYDVRDAPPREIVHWHAVRVATGEAFEAVVRPGHPIAPGVPRHAGLSRERVEAGEPFAVFEARWRAFVRATDVIGTWGPYAADVLESQGVTLPERMDLRPGTAQFIGARAGALESCARSLGWDGAAQGIGRAGLRIAALAVVAGRLVEAAEARRHEADAAGTALPTTG